MVWGAPRQEGQRECEGERKGWEELRHGAVTVPQVPHLREVGWEGQEKMCAVVWGAKRQEGQRASGLRLTLSR